MATINYTASTSTIVNPERGFYKPRDVYTSSFTLLSLSTLQGYRNTDKISLIHRMIYLDSFISSSISGAMLANFQTDFNTMRTAGVKCVLRFAYSSNQTAGFRDASKAQILSHIDQLAPYIQANEDVIYCMQAGFIGTHGEWYYSDYFGTDTLTNQNKADRKEVFEYLANIYSGFIQVRTPLIKTQMYGTTALTGFSSSISGRTGHHNDCFLASATDYGTYTNIAIDLPYLHQETNYVPIGGETCNVNPPRSECFSAQTEMNYLHHTFLNIGYEPNVIASWSGCMSSITNSLGYRLSLSSTTYTNNNFKIALQNDGYAGLYNERDVWLVLRNTSTSAETKIKASEDIRKTLYFDISFSVANGTYNSFLWLPDKVLSGRTEYSIRMANLGTWEASTGYNDLQQTITISSVSFTNKIYDLNNNQINKINNTQISLIKNINV